MTIRPLFSMLCVVASALASSCGGAIATGGPTTTWNGNGQRAPSSVTVSIASVALGDDCGGGSMEADVSAGACPDDRPCGGPSSCQGSSLQLSLSSGPGSGASRFSLESAELYDARTGDRVATLAPAGGQTWSPAGAYVPWDGRVPPSQSMQVSYSLSGLDWSSLSSGGSTYGSNYRLQIVVEIDGEQRTLVSSNVGREPMVDT